MQHLTEAAKVQIKLKSDKSFFNYFVQGRLPKNDYTVINFDGFGRATAELSISGLNCWSAIGELERFISKLGGVISAKVHFLTSRY